MRIVAGADAVPYRDRAPDDAWPEFLRHDAISNRYWSRLYADFPEQQFLLVEGEEVLAEGNCVPVAGQPAQWRDAFLAAFVRGGTPDRLCALAVVVARSRRGRGLSSVMLAHMRELARPFGELVAPVRPTAKDQHPLVPIEEYVSWNVDPWLRTHERLGGEITGVAEGAMVIDGTVDEWRAWTGLECPRDGELVVPGGLVPVRFDAGRGVYREPCVWVRHAV